MEQTISLQKCLFVSGRTLFHPGTQIKVGVRLFTCEVVKKVPICWSKVEARLYTGAKPTWWGSDMTTSTSEYIDHAESGGVPDETLQKQYRRAEQATSSQSAESESNLILGCVAIFPQQLFPRVHVVTERDLRPLLQETKHRTGN